MPLDARAPFQVFASYMHLVISTKTSAVLTNGKGTPAQ